MAKPTEVPIRYRDLLRFHRYQFVIDAANVVRTVNCEVNNDQSNEYWPVMLKDPNNEYLFVTQEEIRNIRLLCVECDSALFVVGPDSCVCTDCGWQVPDERTDVWRVRKDA